MTLEATRKAAWKVVVAMLDVFLAFVLFCLLVALSTACGIMLFGLLAVLVQAFKGFFL